jgi:hypothetical protein
LAPIWAIASARFEARAKNSETQRRNFKKTQSGFCCGEKRESSMSEVMSKLVLVNYCLYDRGPPVDLVWSGQINIPANSTVFIMREIASNDMKGKDGSSDLASFPVWQRWEVFKDEEGKQVAECEFSSSPFFRIPIETLFVRIP